MNNSNITISFGGWVAKGAQLQDASGNQVCNFNVTTGRGDGAEVVQCSLWGRRGAVLAEWLKQHMPVHVSGRLGRSEYQGVVSLTCNVAEIQLLSNVEALEREKAHYKAQREAKRQQQREERPEPDAGTRRGGSARARSAGRRNRVAEGGGPDGHPLIEDDLGEVFGQEGS